MRYIKFLLLDTILILLPMLIYQFYLVNCQNKSRKAKKIALDFAIIGSMLLLILFSGENSLLYPLILWNIPLYISFYKKRSILAGILSLIIVIFYQQYFYVVHFVILEYILYDLIYLIYLVKKKNLRDLVQNLIYIKAFVLAFEVYGFIYPLENQISSFLLIITTIISLYGVTCFIFYLLKKGEEIMDLNSTIKALEKEKMLRASLFKITHEIKNPIAVCKGYLDMLDLSNQEKINKYIPIVKQEIARTLILMDDYLDYTKIKINKEDTDLYLLLADTCSSLESLFRENKVKTIFNIPDKELYAKVDYNRLKQVLVNLFKNALEAKRPDKELTLWLTTRKEKGYFYITIKDNGVGMSEETLNHISEMFYTTKQKGSGMGVSLSKEIIELHNGKLEYFSSLGKGTKVVISFPITEKSLTA